MEKTLDDYIKYLNIDITQQSEALNEVLEDTALRLDEFNGLANMVCSEGVTPACTKIPEINTMKTAVDTLCTRIDALENLIERIHTDIDKMEESLDAAESNLMGSENSLKNIFKPLFFKKSSSVDGAQSKSKSPFEPVELFSTSDYFQNNENENQDETVTKDT